MDYFTHFCPEHIFVLAIIAALITFVLIFTGKAKEKTVTVMLCAMSCLLLVCEALQEFILVHEDRQLIDVLPLHLCNIGIFVNIFATFFAGRIRGFFAEVSVVLIMPGALGALLFPDWNYRPFWSWLPMMCFFTHMLLVLVPLIFLKTGRADISFKHFWYSYAFLLPVVPFILWFDYRFNENYMFLRYPVEYSPLEWTYNLFGKQYYLAGLVVLLTVVLGFEYLCYHIVRKYTHRV